ncbi:phosphatase PAP2 family protein [Arthrobacter sp. DNA4]|uniref:phosphatase PAP2 family protein n=1 Tax=Arthrobacter sp. DNA4 TaxID=2963432 RepID=UPI0020CF7DFB|nr:phosphatase PAP2 family protein [Arthrobacter sp. DNA4]UTT69427.1 phosphatase PAP2 family protein [Arthrobacter sp. DNA4]
MTSHTHRSPEAASPAEAAAVRMAALPQLRHWIAVPVTAAVLIVAAGLALRFIPALTSADMSVDAELSHDHTAPLTGVAMFINVVFSPAGGVLMIAALCLYLLLVRRSPVNAVATGLVAAGGWVSSELFKVLVARHRPDSTALFNPLIPEPGTDSFPSGHVALASALAIAVFLLARGTKWQRPAAILGIVVAVAVAFSRVYLGVHYPTDVTASFLTAATGAAFLTGLWNRFGLALLARIPFLAKLGPVPAPRA